MNRIKLVIIGIFVFTGIISFLLYQQKTQRVATQIEKKNLGWNPVSIKKMIVVEAGKDTVVFSKKDGVWKCNLQFDGMGIATQTINYLSTMQITPSSVHLPDSFLQPIMLQLFDKNGDKINTLLIGNETEEGGCFALVNSNPAPVVLSNKQNKLSLRSLVLGE